MITHRVVLGRKIEESHIEEIYERLHMPKIDQNFAEVLAEFGLELRENPIFASYIKNIGDKRKEYLKRPDIASILQNATHAPVGQQALDQEMLTREERKSEYFGLWIILRFSELYDISSHDQIRAELTSKNDLRDLADFEEGVVVVSNILKGRDNANLADFYLFHAQRLIAGAARFLNEQLSTSNQDQSISCIHPVKTEILNDQQEPINEKNLFNSKNSSVKRKQEITIAFGDDAIELSSTDVKLRPIKKYDNKKRGDNTRFKLLLSLLKFYPQGLSKKKLEEECGKRYGEINRARRGINDRADDKLRCDNLIKLDNKGGMLFNDKHDIIVLK